MMLPHVIGHRGACGYAPENTLPSFVKAHSLGVKWVEFDARICKTGEVVILHDDKLNRTTNGRGAVKETTFEALKALDAGSWYGEAFTDTPVPTLQSLLSYLSDASMGANIEIKAEPGDEEKAAQSVFQLLMSHEFNWGQLIVSSFSIEILNYLRQLSENLPLGFLMDKWSTDLIPLIRSLDCVTIHVNQRHLREKQVNAMLALNRPILVYTVNQQERAELLFNWGVHSVFSDYPDRIKPFHQRGELQ